MYRFSVGFALAFTFVSTVAVAQQAGYGVQDGFQSGGVAPPPPMQTPTPTQPSFQTDTERQLTESEKEDSGRGLEWVYIEVGGGFQVLGLETFKKDGLTYDGVNSSAAGATMGAAAGVRLVIYRIGARARFGLFDQFNLATFNGEVGVRIPIGSWEPYAELGGGYALLSGLDPDAWKGKPSINGWNLRLGAGVDYYLTPTFTLGLNLAGDALFLSRSKIGSAGASNLPASATSKGSGIGASFTSTAVLGLHF